MDWETLVYRYKSLKTLHRYLIVFGVAVLIGLWHWTDDGGELEENLTAAQQEEEGARAKFEAAKKKAGQLPALMQKVSEVEGQLERAQKHLPKSIEFDEILARIGVMEKELGVKMMHFKPNEEVQPNPQLQYKEIPVEITLKADFASIMNMFDRLVHLDQLTHIRDITFKAETGDDIPPGTTVATASLILFKSM